MSDQDETSVAPEAKRGRGRTPYVMSEEHRDKIRNSNILSYLIRAAEGEREMTPTQATIGLGLIKKVLPDLQAVTLAGDENNPIMIGKVERVIVK